MLGANYYGAKLGPSVLAPRSLPRKRHVCVDANVGKDLGTKCAGAKTCNLGANNDGAKLRVHFLKFYWHERICENLKKKAKKKRLLRRGLSNNSMKAVVGHHHR
jgi:hypothetical protein